MITIHESFKDTVIEVSLDIMLKILNGEDSDFFVELSKALSPLELKGIPPYLHNSDVGEHLHTMFKLRLNVKIMPYRTRYPWSSVLAYAEGNTVYINTRKLNDIGVRDRAGNLAHEITHLFGYSHASQGDENSVPVIVGRVMAEYDKNRSV